MTGEKYQIAVLKLTDLGRKTASALKSGKLSAISARNGNANLGIGIHGQTRAVKTNLGR